MFTQKKHVCVIGAGSSGLTAIKELLDEGHEVTCFEKYGQPGGNFYRSDNKETGAYDSTLLTISNYMMAFSSFPPPMKDQRRFWTAAEYQQYLVDFAQKFGLDETIVYYSEVSNVEKNGEGKYIVDVMSTEDQMTRQYAFDAVAVCTGSSRVPKYVEVKGLEDFEGDVFHSAYYRNADPYKGRKALCIGMGETGVDVVNEISQLAEKCVLSVRQYQPIIQRFPFGGVHTSDAYTSHALNATPVVAANARMKFAFKMISKHSKDPEEREYAKWNLKAGHYLSGFNIKSEAFVKRIVDNKLNINDSGIDHIGKDYVMFKDGRKEEIDMIMLNTGYMDKFCFIKDADVTDVRHLYKHMIHPELGDEVVFIGWARPAAGGVPACSEMQARYFALLCSGKKKLPEKEKLMMLIDQQANYEDKVFYRNKNVRSLVQYSKYMSDFSRVIGCSPWRASTFLNPLLTYRLWFGSQMPIIYRLHGPHSDYQKAKKLIFNVPVALPLFEMILMSIYAPISHILANIGVIEPDPKY
ncbi:flavin-containing monooxygenase [Teredinibacter sp. KSP-S5-2]|uniref:flavin-containing monooxygenase n=1 Tax=Teredinibacter sp. KSP-S5-2 TaxID=3034506 RepID=UPI0029348480|nr:NAD(P)-binding domain-containing protein [Teredinibacter sp. KSP-S5-2]WNO10787.1 NAD(P)-binding domain-containing protein [Teredinibacter sp. KSP-S5-2]